MGSYDTNVRPPGGSPHAAGTPHLYTKQVLNRLSRTIGHLTAVKTMVETQRDCAEVLVQISAVRSAITGVCEVILQDHISHCITDAAQNGDKEAVQRVNTALHKLLQNLSGAP